MEYTINNPTSWAELTKIHQFINTLVIKDPIKSKDYANKSHVIGIIKTIKNLYGLPVDTLMTVSEIIEGVATDIEKNKYDIIDDYLDSSPLHQEYFNLYLIEVDIDTVIETNAYKVLLTENDAIIHSNIMLTVAREILTIDNVSDENISEDQTVVEVVLQLKEEFRNREIMRNDYHRTLWEDYGIEPYDVIKAGNRDILYHSPGLLSEEETQLWLLMHDSTAKYWDRVIYTPIFEDMVYYSDYSTFLLVMMVFDRYVSKTLNKHYKPRLMSSTDLKNYLKGYNIEFFNLGDWYSRKIVENMADLQEVKGTNVILKKILNIFSFDNINIKQYYLEKSYIESIDGNDFTFKESPAYRFILKSLSSNDIQDETNARSFDYDTFVANDPIWIATTEQLDDIPFNSVKTKYIALETSYVLEDASDYFNILIDVLNYCEYHEIDISDDFRVAYDPIGGSDVLYIKDLLMTAQYLMNKYVTEQNGDVWEDQSLADFYNNGILLSHNDGSVILNNNTAYIGSLLSAGINVPYMGQDRTMYYINSSNPSGLDSTPGDVYPSDATMTYLNTNNGFDITEFVTDGLDPLDIVRIFDETLVGKTDLYSQWYKAESISESYFIGKVIERRTQKYDYLDTTYESSVNMLDYLMNSNLQLHNYVIDTEIDILDKIDEVLTVIVAFFDNVGMEHVIKIKNTNILEDSGSNVLLDIIKKFVSYSIEVKDIFFSKTHKSYSPIHDFSVMETIQEQHDDQTLKEVLQVKQIDS